MKLRNLLVTFLISCSNQNKDNSEGKSTYTFEPKVPLPKALDLPKEQLFEGNAPAPISISSQNSHSDHNTSQLEPSLTPLPPEDPHREDSHKDEKKSIQSGQLENDGDITGDKLIFERPDLESFSLGYSKKDNVTDSSNLSDRKEIPALYEKIYLGVISCNEDKKVEDVKDFSVEYFIEGNPEDKFELVNNVISWKVGEVNDGDGIKVKAKATVSTDKVVESEIELEISKHISSHIELDLKRRGLSLMRYISLTNGKTKNIYWVNPNIIEEVAVYTYGIPFLFDGKYRCPKDLTFKEFEKLKDGDVYEIKALYGESFKLQFLFDKNRTEENLQRILDALNEGIKETTNESIESFFLGLANTSSDLEKILIDFQNLVLDPDKVSGNIFKGEYDFLFKKLLGNNKKIYEMLVQNSKKLEKYGTQYFSCKSLNECFIRDDSFYINNFWRDKKIDDTYKEAFCYWIFQFYDTLYRNRYFLEQDLYYLRNS